MSRQCRADRRSSRELGFSLIETMTATLLMAVVAGMAMQLWNHSLHLIGSSGRSLTDASMVPLAAALRSDLLVATEVEAAPTSWTGGALVLHAQGELIRYQLHAGAVTRTRTAAESKPASRRFGSTVNHWQWRMAESGLIEIRVGQEVHEEPWTAAQRPDPEQRARTVAKLLEFKLALRGQDGGSSW